MNKIHDRACGRCGRAVVIPTPDEIEQAFRRLSRSECPFPISAWVKGHLIEQDDRGNTKTTKIRCMFHVED
jgi:hypothetical protein